MNAGEDYRSREVERLRTEVAGLLKENAGLRDELREARSMPVLNAPTVVGVAVLCILAALQTCEWKSRSPVISGRGCAVSAPARYRARRKHGMTGSMNGPQSPA